MAQEIRISEEQINNFLVGKDPQTGIIGIECSYNDAEASIIYRTPDGKKKIKKDDFRPFLWAKTSGAKRLFLDDKGRQNREKLKKKMDDYGIQIKKLNIYTEAGTTVPRLENGYKLLFTATKPMSFVDFLKFFRMGGVDTYDGSKDFLQVSPVEQYMMRSGKRLFKGFEDYDELDRLEFDLETEGLNPYIHRISQIGIRTNRGYEHIIHIDGETESEKDTNELAAIDEYFRVVHELKPDVITGQNVENFDWDFFIVRCEVLGTTIGEVSGKYFREPLYKSKKKTVLKLGGEMEYFNKTNLWGFHLTDSLHAIRRAQAIDSNMKKADLKYVTKYSKLNKPNRVYVPGDKIEKVYRDVENQYAFNEKDGSWYPITDKHGLDEGYEVKTGRFIVERYLLDDLYETDKVELRYNQSNFLLGKLLPTTFSRVCTMGTAGIWKLIMMAWSFENNLAIPDFDAARRFTGGLSRLLKVGYVPNVVKLDYNSLYPAVILTWSITAGHDISNVMLSLLNYILAQREKFKELKAVGGAKAKEAKKELELLEPNSTEWHEKKKEVKKWDEMKNSNDKKQLPFKIFANSFFGGFGAPNLFPWGDVTCAEKTTCIGRQSLRLMIKWFSEKGYTPIVGDTDGFNFSMPPKEELDKRVYIGKGLNRDTELGKEYHGVEADVAEFDDLFMRGKMGLGIDEYANATINFSRKNYSDLLADGEVKYVGNTIKSKKMPVYIEKFMESGIKLLLNNKGKEFLDAYYDYIEKIYNYQIPLREIASKGKVNKTISDYKKECHVITKAGRPKNRQVWYELCIMDNYEPKIGETVYYINTGDGKKKTTYKDVEKRKIKGKEGAEDSFEIIVNCVRLDPNIVEAEEDTFCTDNMEYNAPKYIEQFNKRINPLLVCFSPEIRDRILIKTPDKRQYFTESDAKLDSGHPNKPENQDSYEQLLTMEDKEIGYWISVDEIPPFMDELDVNWPEVVNVYTTRMERLKEESIALEVEKYNKILSELVKKDVDDFIDDVKIPKGISDFLKLDPSTLNFISKEHNIVIGSAYDITDKEFTNQEDDDDDEEDATN